MQAFTFIVFLFASVFSFASLDHSSQLAIDEMAETFHQRMTQREPHLYQGADIQIVSSIPQEILALQERELETLLQFARDYDLFSLGFDYQINQAVYSIAKDGQTLAYSISIDIYNNGIKTFGRFYLLSKRIDGIFYTSHIGTYDYEL